MKLILAAAIATLQTQSTLAEPTPLKVFVTSQSFDGNLGGVSGADAKCQALADAASLPGPFFAWISDASSSPTSRFINPSGLPYQLVDGTATIANNLADLIDGNIQTPIIKDETGLGPVDDAVWTGTTATSGLEAGCSNWISNSPSANGKVGRTLFTGGKWTDNILKMCNQLARLYCFQQDTPTPEPTSSPTSAPSKAPSNTPSSSPSNAPTLSKSGKSSTTKASKDMDAKSGKSVKASKDGSLDFNELVLLILAIFFIILQDSDGSMLGALLEDIQVGDGIRGRRILEDKEDLKALLISLLEEKLDLDEY